MVTQGAQQGLDLLARVMLDPGDLAVVEEPGYPPARASLLATGAEVRGVPVDAEGCASTCCRTTPSWSTSPRRTSSRWACR